jgi:hypothetical protein
VLYVMKVEFALLDTNSEYYVAACSLDLSFASNIYDIFALRDVGSYNILTQT